MAYELSTVDVWAGSIEDRPGGLARVMESLAKAGVSLQFIIARRDTPGKGVVFCAPIEGAAQVKAAKATGLAKSNSLRSLRVEGPDKAGLGELVTRAVASARVNVRGLSGAALGKRAVIYLAFDSRSDATRASNALKSALK